MINPVQQEHAFRQLVQQLEATVSKRSRLFLIADFLEMMESPIGQAESYLLQCIPYLPVFSSPYEITGVAPHVLLALKQLLLNIFTQAGLFGNSHLIAVIDSLEWSIRTIQSWVGEQAGQKKVDKELLLLDSSSKKHTQSFHSVLVPVIEKVGDNYSGRLRNLQVKSVGKVKNGQHELTPLFSVVGTESDQQMDISKPVKAVLFLTEMNQILSKSGIQATASFEQTSAWHSGNSANLALAGLFFCTIIDEIEIREQFRLNPAIAITGEVSETADVLPVDQQSLKAKVEAAFYSWTHVLVVPKSQVEETTSYLNILKEKYPKRDLQVIGVDQLKELFYDRRLTLYSKINLQEYVSGKLWKRKFSVVAMVGYVVLIAILAALLIGPTDRNPVQAEYSGEMMYLKNKNGRVVYAEQVGSVVVDLVNRRERASVEFYDENKDSFNEVIKSEYQNGSSSQKKLHLLSHDLTDTLWSIGLNFNIPFESHPNLHPNKYDIDDLMVYDLNKDGESEIVAALSHSPYFPSFIGVFNIHSGELERYYAIPGHTKLEIIDDIDHDGEAEIVIAAQLKGYRLNTLVILPENFETSRAPLGLRYDSSLPTGTEKAIIGIPTSIVGRTYYLERGELGRYGAIQNIRFSSQPNQILVTFYEAVRTRGTDYVNLGLLYSFNQRLNIVGVGSNDNYDVVSEEMYVNGTIPFLPDASYMESRKDSLLYWNGTTFQSKPTLNKRYLESIKEDSTYYKEWYFREE